MSWEICETDWRLQLAVNEMLFLSCWCYSSQASSQEPQSPPPPLPPRISLRQVDTPVRDSSLLADAGQCMRAAYSGYIDCLRLWTSSADFTNILKWIIEWIGPSLVLSVMVWTSCEMNCRKDRPIISSVSDGMNKLLKWIVERIDPSLVLLVMVWTSSACFILF